MSTPAEPNARRRYLVAAGLVVVAVALGSIFGVVVARALSGYDITPFAVDQDTSVTVGDRDLAIWASPASSAVTCTSDSFSEGTASMTVTLGSRSWKRIGLVKGDPGSSHTVSCTGAEGGDQVGYADNPRVLRYVVLGAALGGTAVLLVLVAFVLALVTALRRPRAA